MGLGGEQNTFRGNQHTHGFPGDGSDRNWTAQDGMAAAGDAGGLEVSPGLVMEASSGRISNPFLKITALLIFFLSIFVIFLKCTVPL